MTAAPVATKPPFTYFGGKTRLAPRIVDLLPDHQHYVEPFAGSLAVLLAKPRTPFETVNDLDGDLMCFWRVLRDRGDELARACALTPHARAEHTAAVDSDVADELERARRVWVRLSQSRGSTRRTTGWRFYREATGRGFSMPATLNAYVDRMMIAAERLAGVSLECRPALELISDYGQHANVCLYVDPPYLGSTRGVGNHYRHEMRTPDLHRELADALHDCDASIVLSGYASPLYDELYGDWRQVKFTAFTAQGLREENASGHRIEVLWSNRPFAAAHLFTEEVPDHA